MRRYAPVAVFAYNRPDHLRLTLISLAAANGADRTHLHLFCDGPKSAEDEERTQSVLAVAIDPEWERRFGSVKVATTAINKGLARSIIDGVTKVLSCNGCAIILEDDLLVAPDFLDFMNDCLDFYKGDARIASISGFSPLRAPPVGYESDIVAVPRNCSHGWATWADRWNEVDWQVRDVELLCRRPELRSRLNSAGSDRLFRLFRSLKGGNDSWSIRFGLWQAVSGRLTIYPVQNRIRNIGFDGSGVHTRTGEEINNYIPDVRRPVQLECVEVDPRVLAAFRKIYSGSLLGRLKRRSMLLLWMLKRKRVLK
jgi:hypothetical protein